MRRTVGVLLILACMTEPALARDKKPRPPRTPSSEERKSKSYTVEGQPLTLFVSTVNGGSTSGGSAGIFVDADTILRGTLRGGRSCLEARCSYVESSGSITVQRFLDNSLFLEAGFMTQRNIFHHVSYDGDYEKYDSGFTYTVNTFGPTVALGNQWQWGTFTLGVRWVQAYRPWTSRGTTEHQDDPNAQRGENQRLTRRALEHEKKLYLPSISLGYAF